MRRDLRAEMESWAQQTGSKKDQRAALVQIVLSGAMTFEQAKAEAAELERRSLVERVRDGEKNPSEAEEEAARLGCGPLIPIPDPVRFDPMRESYWTLHMALAWIMWRTVDDVRRHWDEWRDEAKQWQLNGDRGHSLRSMQRSSFSELRQDELISEPPKGNPPRISAEQARFELRQFLQLGKLTACAVSPSTGKRVKIKKHEFFDLRIVSESGEDRLEPGGYQQLLLEREKVLCLPCECRVQVPRMARSRDERITGSATGQPQEIREAGTRQILRAEQGRIRESLDRSHQGHWCMRVEQARPQAEITGIEIVGRTIHLGYSKSCPCA